MDQATQYCKDVLSGKIIAGKKIKQACRRHLDDIKRSKDDDCPYYYSEERAEHVVSFISLMPDVSTGEPFTPAPFQVWIVSMLFGWRTKDGDHVRFNKALISMARTNSKTVLMAFITVYALLYGEPAQGRQIVFVANAMKQAKIGFKYDSLILRKLRTKSSYLKKKVDVLSTEIRIEDNGSFIMPYASDSSTLDGIHATVACVDEYHEFKDRNLVNVLQSGMIQNPDSMLVQISTAGLDVRVPMYQDYKMLAKVLDGDLELDNYFIAIWEQDDEEEMNNPKTWEKSNPLMCVPEKKKVLTKAIAAERDTAIQQGTTNAFLVKNLNLWRQASEDSMIGISDWRKTIKKDFVIQDRDVYIGIDLSKSNDTTAIGFIYPYLDKDDGRNKFHVNTHSFVATKYGGIETVEKNHGLPYRLLEKKGECDITRLESGIIDIDFVYDWLINFVQENHLRVMKVCYDDWNFNSVLAKIENSQVWKLVPVRQGTKSLNSPTRELRMQIFDKRITHDDNQILESSFTNAILLEDNNGIKVDKAKNANKIDPVDAVIDAFTQAMYYFEEDHEDDIRMNNDELNAFFKSDQFSF